MGIISASLLRIVKLGTDSEKLTSLHLPSRHSRMCWILRLLVSDKQASPELQTPEQNRSKREMSPVPLLREWKGASEDHLHNYDFTVCNCCYSGDHLYPLQYIKSMKLFVTMGC